MKKRPTIRHSRSARDNQFGKFIGKPQTVWEDDGRNMTLLQDFIYEDPKQQIWTASVGSRRSRARDADLSAISGVKEPRAEISNDAYSASRMPTRARTAIPYRRV
jgi:hypothetical protein